MQEPSLYQALLSDLTDQEFVSLVGLQFQKRMAIGGVLMVQLEGSHIYYAGIYPPDWEKLHQASLPDQLKHLAALALHIEGNTTARYPVEEDDFGTDSTTDM